MIIREDPKLINSARALRRRMTRQERRLWYDFLRSHRLHFYKQRVIGRYIADFYCAAADLVIELDGSGHYKPEKMADDKLRDEEMEKLGLTVLRIPNYEVDSNFEEVCLYIDRTAAELIAAKNKDLRQYQADRPLSRIRGSSPCEGEPKRKKIASADYVAFSH